MNDIQDMIADSANRMFADSVDRRLLDSVESGSWPADLWNLVEESGFTKVLVPESAGGTSGRWSDACPLLHALGYHRVPLPLSETIIASGLLAQAGIEIPDGPLTLIQQSSPDTLKLALEGGRLRIDGVAESVPWARFAKALVIAGGGGQRCRGPACRARRECRARAARPGDIRGLCRQRIHRHR